MNPMDWANAFKMVAVTAMKLVLFLKTYTPRSILYLFVALTTYLGSQVIAEDGDVAAGFKRAVTFSEKAKAIMARQKGADLLQAELYVIQKSNQLIEDQLTRLLAINPSPSRARVIIFHNSVYTLAGVGMLRFDITHGLARPGRAVGDFTSNLPMSQLNDYFDELIARECKHLRVSDMENEAAIARMNRLNITDFVVCPAINPRNNILGAVFMSWDRGDPVPRDMAATTATLRESAALVAIALDLRPALSSSVR